MEQRTRTHYGRFLKETGITFPRWKQQARLLESIRRLAQGTAVTVVAFDLGYESPREPLHKPAFVTPANAGVQ